MADIGRLAAKIVADPAGFKTGLDQAAAHAKTWQKNIGTVLSFGIAGIGVGFVGRRLIGAIDELENVGDQAARAGLDVEQFMKVVGTLDAEDTQLAITAMTKLRKTLADVATGGKESAEKLIGAGLDPKQLKADGLANALQRVSKAYTEALDPIKAYSIAFAAFGKSASEIIPVLDKLANLSGKQNRFAGQTVATIAEATEAHEAKTAISNFWDSFVNQVAIGTVKTGKRIGDALTTMPSERGGINFQLLEPFLGDLGDDATRRAEARAAQAKVDAAQRAAEKQEKIKADLGIIVDRLKIGKNWLDGWVDSAGKFSDQIFKALDEDKLNLFQATRTPLEQFQEEMKRLDRLGTLGLDKDVKARAMLKAFDALEGSLNRDTANAPRPLQRGSVEELSRINQHERTATQRNESEQQKRDRILQDAFKQQADYQRRIADAVENPPFAVVDF